MFIKSASRFSLALFFVAFFGIQIADACMGVSRTIHINNFNAHMGTGGSGGIGLRHKEVVLTFDDGPIASTTPRVLAALDNECLKATFFVVGNMARFNSKLLQRIAKKGHTIGHHTIDHANLTRLSPSAARKNIARGMQVVNAALGPYKYKSSKLFRYPYLARSSRLDSVVKSAGLLPFSAGVMSQDWKSSSPTQMINRVMGRLNRLGRGVILLHDIQHKTASALPQLLNRLEREGYRVVHVKTGRPSKTPIIARVSKKEKKKAKPNRQVVALKKQSQKQPQRKRWSLFRRNSSSEALDETVTGSVKNKREEKKVAKKAILPKTKTAHADKEKAKTEGRKGLLAWMKKRREERAAQSSKDVSSKKSKTSAKKPSSPRKTIVAAKPKKASTLAAKENSKEKAQSSGLSAWIKKRREARRALAQKNAQKTAFKKKEKTNANKISKKPSEAKVAKSKASKTKGSPKKASEKKPTGMVAWIKKRREQRKAGIDGTTTGSIKKKSKTTRALKKPTSSQKARKTVKDKPAAEKGLFAKLRERRKKRLTKASAKKEPVVAKKKTRKSSKKVSSAKKTAEKKKRSSFFFPDRLKRKEGESDAAYHARLRARRIRLNKS